MVYCTQITIVTGVYKPTYNWGAPHSMVWYGMVTWSYPEYITDVRMAIFFTGIHQEK